MTPLLIICLPSTPAHIITIIKEELEKAGGLGVVVIIDNYTKLEGQSGVKAMR